MQKYVVLRPKPQIRDVLILFVSTTNPRLQEPVTQIGKVELFDEIECLLQPNNIAYILNPREVSDEKQCLCQPEASQLIFLLLLKFIYFFRCLHSKQRIKAYSFQCLSLSIMSVVEFELYPTVMKITQGKPEIRIFSVL